MRCGWVCSGNMVTRKWYSTATHPFIYYVNGSFLEADKAFVHIRDLGILRGYGCFDYFRTYNGKPFNLIQNVHRLRNSCKIIDLDFPWSDDGISSIILQTLQRNEGKNELEKGIRVVVSGGIATNNINPDGEPTLAVLVENVPAPPEICYTHGAKVVTVKMGRLYPTSKTTNYIPAIIAQKQALKLGGVEAVYVSNNFVQEGTTSNIFAFYGNTLATPDGDILQGRTRAELIAVAKNQFDLQLRPISYENLLEADEVFLTSATKRVLPIVDVDGKSIGDGKVGKNTKALMKMFDEVCYKACPL